MISVSFAFKMSMVGGDRPIELLARGFSYLNNISFWLALFSDQDHFERLHHSRLPRQVDADHQVSGDDARRVGRPQSREGGAVRPRGCVLREHIFVSLSQIREKRSEEERGKKTILNNDFVNALKF